MLHDPLTLPRDDGDSTPTGILVGCPAAVGISDWPGSDAPHDERCSTCQGAGAVEKIGFSSYQRLEGYR